MNHYAIVMAGGSGKRLWPLSRANQPKQFLDLFGDGSFLQQTIRRMHGLADKRNILVVGSRAQREPLRRDIGGLLDDDNLLLEPEGRNTAPCIAYALAHIRAVEAYDAVLCILPADHHIGNPEAFRDSIRQGLAIAADTDRILTLGIVPDHPSTKYGYLQTDGALPGHPAARRVLRFVEKPAAPVAQAYLEQGGYYWNGGIFIARARVLEEELRLHMPGLLEQAEEAYRLAALGMEWESREAYARTEAVSIDYGVMERCGRIAVIPCDCGWSDAGSFDIIGEIAPRKDSGNNTVLKGRCIALEARGNLISSERRLTVVCGVENLVIVDSGDVLYITSRDMADPRPVLQRVPAHELEGLE